MSLSDTTPPDVAAQHSASRGQLWTEFLALFIGVPVLMAVFFEFIQANRLLFAAVWALAGVAAFLLWRTPGWSFRKLLAGPVLSEWRFVLAFSLLTGVTCTAFVFAINPDLFLIFPRFRPELWIFVIIAYPLLSAWPQEVIYRSLFFERYSSLFPGHWALIIANGAVFGFGHLFYMNWITISMTAVGGAVMGWAYLRHRSMPLAWLLHAIAGNVVFTMGLGQFFYSGAVN
ncbi:MAG: CPBP family intramembrane glutamic endopeptidase [Paracoccaceae bacterium]